MHGDSISVWRADNTALTETKRDLTIQAFLLTFLPLRPPEQRANKRPPQGGRLRKVTTECFSHPRYLLPPGDRLLGFCLFSTLEMIVGLHEEKPGTLPIAARTCLL